MSQNSIRHCVIRFFSYSVRDSIRLLFLACPYVPLRMLEHASYSPASGVCPVQQHCGNPLNAISRLWKGNVVAVLGCTWGARGWCLNGGIDCREVSFIFVGFEKSSRDFVLAVVVYDDWVCEWACNSSSFYGAASLGRFVEVPLTPARTEPFRDNM